LPLQFESEFAQDCEDCGRPAKAFPAGPTPGGGYDMMLGRAPGDAERFCYIGGHRVATSTPFVYATGGGYFFAPSISAIRKVLA